MPEPITIALIAAGATVLAAGVAAWATVRAASAKAAKATPQASPVIQQSSVSFSVDRMEIETTIDNEGSGVHERRWSGMHASQTITNLKVPYRLKVSPGGRVHLPEVKPLNNSALPVSFEQSGDIVDGVVQGHLVFLGVINDETPFVGYQLRQRIDRAFCLTQQEAKEKYKNDAWKTEYISGFIACLTKTLRVTVNFPESFAGKEVQVGAVVFGGLDEQPHEVETKRVADLVVRSKDGRSATFQINDPVFGFRYALWWWPPE